MNTLTRPTRIIVQILLLAISIAWLFPFLWAVFNSFRDYAYTSQHGYFSFGGLTLSNWANAWERGGFGQSFLNSAIITICAVILTLALSSCMAFVLSRFSFRLNIGLLGFFVAANLLPPQSLLVPIYRMFRMIPMPEFLSDSGTLLNTHAGVILVNVAFQTGFCTFVLSNYMKSIPREIYESAEVDGAGIWRQFWTLTMPLCRTPLAALATLQTAWIYNEFFWATVLLQSGDKFPVTSSLNNLQGSFFTDYNLLSAGSLIAALPILIVFFVLQRQFVSGLTMGSTKG
ncbi:carbohydrate ABC transporter permease [Brachybacterium sp. JHP9]|uniref:Carbohydrate ABC transporter permease n=1 Tax=Brachybacterium equifaecis TaxID=2910770 RepID=A0ABT0R0V9_9MICO|nr:carbohydrate ABC transporter permease [Brachybacterium equifaecis]MCL6423078.1 carbohydrate ABC transporter permease [Brachybacterium equifaecis]